MADQTIDDVSSVVSAEVAPPAIVLIGGALVLAPTGVVQLGRHVACGRVTAEIDDERMSREHATVQFGRGGWRIVDQGSRNGTYVDGVKLAGETIVAGDAILRLGHTLFALRRDGRGHDATTIDTDTVIGPELSRAYDAIRRHATTDTLLVHGESGSGKELAARLYHDARTPDGPFVAVNCAAIPEGVAERLLFGSKRGAFSGAVDAVGYLQSANGGTLFLDEIADLEPTVQAKLLRVLETREVVPIGATAAIALALGIVAASHRDLRAATAEKRFREDLYFRLARAVVELPPLRARPVDAARLATRELASVDRKLVAHARLIEACCLRAWPGNVRELRAAIRHAGQLAIAAGRTLVRVEDLPEHAGLALRRPETPASPGLPPATVVDRPAILAAIAEADGVLSVAARALGLHRTQLYRLMDKLGIARDG